ncbi:MAG: alpha/beta hydrolase [Gammaproteobacteria bacterium]|nr:alpha/beta hydrolase [Gammaproteobacteria bacterium]
MNISSQSLYSTAALFLAFCVSTVANAQTSAFLKTTQTFADDARGFCLDLPGAPPNMNFDRPIQSHSCKYGVDSSDLMFEMSASGLLRAPAFDICVAAERIAAGSSLYARPCANSAEQTWSRGADGAIHPASRSDLCVTLSSNYRLAGTPAWITPVFHARDVSLEACSSAALARQQFRPGMPDELPSSFVATPGRQMPEHLASAVREIVSRGAGARETARLYDNEPRVYELSEVEVSGDIVYGPHERHRLDVHTSTVRRSSAPVPVVVYVHGGGFVRGNRQASRNVSDYFASLGLVGVNITYRLAPEAKWPAGSRDVASAIDWVRENIADYGGDPSRIYVIGKSAGAFHVAEFALRPSVAGDNGPAVAGVVLVSGTYVADTDNPSQGRIDYFGENLSRWPDISILENIERTEIPFLLSISDFDSDRTKASFAELARALTVDYRRMPRVVQLSGHDHYAPNPSIGTVDTQLSAEILHLIRLTSDGYQPMSATQY